uniref:HTH_38 domain-containing protein n=1 Tax=Heterorhabditis bacteriophora TaxID=37862 RepID=A0A1I7WUW1_HETBA
MGRASTLSLHKRSQIKALSTTGYTMKQIANIFERSRKAIMNLLHHQEEYGTKKSSEKPSKLNSREKKEILRTASNNTISITEIRRTCGIDASETTLWIMLNNKPNMVRLRIKRNFAGGSVMVWGAFNAIGLVDLTKMKSTDYQDVSGHYLVPYL